MDTVITPRFPTCVVAGGGIVGQGGERIRAIIEELGCEVQVSREPLAGIAGHKRVTRWQGVRGFQGAIGEKCGDKDGLRPRQQAL